MLIRLSLNTIMVYSIENSFCYLERVNVTYIDYLWIKLIVVAVACFLYGFFIASKH
jgi:hypothetical protein